VSLTAKEINDLNRMNRAAQNPQLGTIIASLMSATSGSFSGSSLSGSIITHIAETGSMVHGLGTISTQSASNVNITGGSITGIGFSHVNVSASSLTYMVQAEDYTVRCNATSGSIGINLLPAVNSGRIHNIKNLYTSNCVVKVTADTTGTPDLIDGETTQTIPVKSNMTIQDNALNHWDIL